MTRIRVANPEYASMATVSPLDLAAVQGGLEPDQTLISYFVTAKRAHVFVVGPSSLHHVPIALDETARQDLLCLSAEVSRFTSGSRRGSEALSGCSEDGARTGRLHHLLFAPLKARIRGARVLVVPHGPLHFLPLAVLKDPSSNRFLLEDYTFSYLPSASVLPLLRAKESPFEGHALVLGAPQPEDPELAPLPGAAEEARQVAALWGARPWLGSEATESRFKREGRHADLVHIAAHALYNPRSSAFTHLALTPDDTEDGDLEVHELLSEVDLSGVNLVVLSACESALGQRSAGDEVASLARAILYAGSPAVVSTAWKIDDPASAMLMTAFYRHLKRGRTVADALRQAQLELLRDGSHGSPFYWGAFTLSGDSALGVEPRRRAAGEERHLPASGPARHALLIGVGRYAPGSGWSETSAARDLSPLRATLERYGFAAPAIAELRDEQATREEILRAIDERLLAPAAPGDLTVLFFGGHGRQLSDLDPLDEIDGYDEAIVPYDAPFSVAAQGGTDRYLRDDTVGELLERLRRRVGPTGQVVVLLDTCYSGTAARSDHPERGGPPLGPPWPRSAAGPEDAGSGFVDGARGTLVSEEGLAPWVVVSAARSGERALEVRRPDGRTSGSLCWAFCKALDASPPPATYSAMAERMRRFLEGVVSNRIQVEGTLGAPLFQGPLVVEEPFFTVGPVDGEPTSVRLHPGLLAGLTAATELEIHPTGASAPTVGEPLAIARVIDASPYEARAELSRPLSKEILAGARAFVVRDAAQDLRPRLVLNRYLRQLEVHDPEVHLDLEVVAVELHNCLDPERPTRLSCQVVEVPRQELGGSGRPLELPVGSFFELRLHGRGAAAFVTVLDLVANGGIAVLWPPPGARERSGRTRDSVQVLDPVFRVTEPCGTDTLLLIASAEPIDFSPLHRLDPSVLGRGELERLGPFAPLFEESFLRGGPPPVLHAPALSVSRKELRIVPRPPSP